MATYLLNKGINVIGTLVRAFNMQNVEVRDARDNPYKPAVVQAGFVQPDETRPAKMAGMGGIPVFVDVLLTGPSGNANTPDTYYDYTLKKNVEIPIVQLETVICTMEQPMTIVKTAIQGRNGTVKEYIGMDDAKITLNGVICGTNGVYPKNDVQVLMNWAKAPTTKGIVSRWLQNLGVTNIVVESISIPQMAGGYSYQAFSINCVSDLPVELKYQ